MNLDLTQVSSVLAHKYFEIVSEKGYPTEDRVLIISPKGEQTTNSGIIIPDSSSKELPRKGTIIQIGHITEQNYSFKKLEIGDLITFGLYAGKELELPELDIDTNKYTISVLSLNEIIYIEKQ